MKRKIYSTLLFLLLVTLNLIWAQSPYFDYLEEPVPVEKLSRRAWENALDELEYDESILEESIYKNEEDDPFSGGSVLSPERRSFWQIILIGLVLISFIWLIVYLLSKGELRFTRNRNKNLSGKIKVETQEERLPMPEKTPEDKLNDLIAAGSFTEAIRLHYLNILNTLTKNKSIVWKKDKTNHEYVRELQGSSFYNSFKEITYLFEYYQYGGFPLSAQSFQRIFLKFKHFLESIKE